MRCCARMRRRWGSRRFLDRCRLVCDALDRPALTTDIIVGFPGETDEDFRGTCQVSEEVGFSKIHIFPFSPRKSTSAATMPDQVSPEVKDDRVRQLQLLERQLQSRYFASLRGRELEVLVEDGGGRPGHVMGTACRYAPVQVPGGGELAGTRAGRRRRRRRRAAHGPIVSHCWPRPAVRERKPNIRRKCSANRAV